MVIPLLAVAQERDTDMLVHQLDSLVQTKMPQGGMVGVSVFDLNDNQPLYVYQADTRAIPN